MTFRKPFSTHRAHGVARASAIAFASLAAVALLGCAELGPPEAEYPAPPRPVEVAAPEVSSEPAAVAVDSTTPAGNASGDEIAIGVDAATYADADPSALTEFRTVLDPHGTWAEDPTYGVVWTPSPTVVGADFAPYVTAGRWTYDREYVWVSDYDWGWAPFHYGRWVYIAGRGWSWIPGRRYSGAWVVWRVGDPGFGYVGWAPAPPTWYWRGRYAYGLARVPPAPYVFCPVRHVFEPRPFRRIATGSEVAAAAAGTRPYVPARPTVNPDPPRVIASPSVGSDRVIATPEPNGPSPREIGIAEGSAPPPPSGHAGLDRAREMAQPRAALASRPVPLETVDPATVAQGPKPLPRRLDAPTRLPDLHVTHPSQRIPSFGAAPGGLYGTPPSNGSPPMARAPSFQQAPVLQSPPSSFPRAPVFQQAPQRAAPPVVFRPQAPPTMQAAPRNWSAPTFRQAPSPPPMMAAPSRAPSFRQAPTVAAPRRTPGFMRR